MQRIVRYRLILILILCGFAGFALISCTTRSSAEKRAREAFIQGQMLAHTQSAQQIVTVRGDVMNPTIPYTKDLTLAKALLAARWRGIREPSFITIIRGEESFKLRTRDFFVAGEDLPLEAGDIIVLER
ncbi:MAG: hypothetical protein ACP5MG_03210 [Verrucomicrobiia bacterium]